MLKISAITKNNLFYLIFIVVFVFILMFSYLKQGVPAAFFMDLGASYSDLANGTTNIILSYFTDWNDFRSSPFFQMGANTHLIGPIFFSFFDDMWLRIKFAQALQVFVAAVSCYFLSFSFFKKRGIALISGLGYATTPILFSILNGYGSIVWGYALLPLAVFFIEKSFISKKIAWALVAGITLSCATFLASVQFVFYVGMPIFVYVAVRVGTAIKRDISNKCRNATLAIVIAVSVFSFSAFFLLPLFLESQPYTTSQREEEYRKTDFVTNFYTPRLEESLSLQSKEQIVSAEFGYEMAQLPLGTRTIYTMASLLAWASIGLVFFKKNIFTSSSYYWPFITAAFFSLLFSFGKYIFLYRILDDYLPYFWTIRTPGRFLFFYALFVSIIAPVVMWQAGIMILRWLKVEKKASSFNLPVIAVAIALIFYTANFYGQALWTLKSSNSMDEHYPDLSLVRQKLQEFNPDKEYRVLDLVIEKDGNPHHLKAYSVGQRVVSNDYDLLWRFGDDRNLARILGVLNIKYILTAPWPAWPEILDAPFPAMEETLTRGSDFNLIHTTPSGIRIWENKLALPRSYIATPVVMVGPPSGFSSFFDAMPGRDNFALFFSNQIQDKKTLERIVSQSSLVFVDYDNEPRPEYLDKFDSGFVYNDEFYLNPEYYNAANREIITFAKSHNIPVIEKKSPAYSSVVDLLANGITASEHEQEIAIVRQEGINISPQGKSGNRLEPNQFDQKAEIVYRIRGKKEGKIRAEVEAFSLFDKNFVKLSVSKDNKIYTNILELSGNNSAPAFYSGNIHLDLDSELFLKAEIYTSQRTAREIYDSRIEHLRLAFIGNPQYNYTNVDKKGLPDLVGGNSVLNLDSVYPGKFNYSFTGSAMPVVVNTETYSSQWFMGSGSQKIKSLPVNIFSNGFLASDLRKSFSITYGINTARIIGVVISLSTLGFLIFTFKRRI